MINDILSQVKMSSINETLMRQQSEDKAVENQSNLEKLSKSYVSSLQTQGAIDAQGNIISANNNPVNSPQIDTNVETDKNKSEKQKKKVNYTLNMDTNQIFVINKEKVEFRFTREGDFLNASLTGECWMKYDNNLEFDTVVAKIVG